MARISAIRGLRRAIYGGTVSLIGGHGERTLRKQGEAFELARREVRPEKS